MLEAKFTVLGGPRRRKIVVGSSLSIIADDAGSRCSVGTCGESLNSSGGEISCGFVG